MEDSEHDLGRAGQSVLMATTPLSQPFSSLPLRSSGAQIYANSCCRLRLRPLCKARLPASKTNSLMSRRMSSKMQKVCRHNPRNVDAAVKIPLKSSSRAVRRPRSSRNWSEKRRNWSVHVTLRIRCLRQERASKPRLRTSRLQILIQLAILRPSHHLPLPNHGFLNK